MPLQIVVRGAGTEIVNGVYDNTVATPGSEVWTHTDTIHTINNAGGGQWELDNATVTLYNTLVEIWPTRVTWLLGDGVSPAPTTTGNAGLPTDLTP